MKHWYVVIRGVKRSDLYMFWWLDSEAEEHRFLIRAEGGREALTWVQKTHAIKKVIENRPYV